MRTIFKTAAVLLTAFLFQPAAYAQSGEPNDIVPDRGFLPSHSYSQSPIDAIDDASGALSLRIPLVSLPPGPNGFTSGVALIYSSKIWETYPDLGPDPRFPYHQLVAGLDGGWRFAFGYRLGFSGPADPTQDPCHGGSVPSHLVMTLPDGSRHKMAFNFSGPQTGCVETWYSTDSTFLRLLIQPGAHWPNNPWTLYFPDGSRVVYAGAGAVSGLQQTLFDRNGNFIQFSNQSGAAPNNYPQQVITDEYGRSITVEHQTIPQPDGSTLVQDVVTATGGNAAPLTWTVKWKPVSLSTVTYVPQPNLNLNTTTLFDVRMVDQITLPQDHAGLPNPAQKYQFTYGGTYGELSQMILPTGAKVDYAYQLDHPATPPLWYAVLANTPVTKTLSYDRQFDGQTTRASEQWTYNFTSSASQITTPDGGVTRNSFYPVIYTSFPGLFSGSVYKTIAADGGMVQRVWKQNIPPGAPGEVTAYNPWIQSEYTTIANSSGAPTLTSAHAFSRDKNGNLTSEIDSDWLSVVKLDWDGTGTPFTSVGPQLKLTRLAYVAATPDAMDSTTATANAYLQSSAPALLNMVASKESGTASAESRTEYGYDANGNLQSEKFWNSAGAYSNPLSPFNSFSTLRLYDGRGNLNQLIDARFHSTAYTYDPIAGCASPNGCGQLYLTQVKDALGHTRNYTYDFNTGLVTTARDQNGGVTSTTYDDFGRPLSVAAAGVNTTAYTYDDTNRMIVVRRDLDVNGDGKLVSIQHFDQLGRVRLSRQLETAAASVTDETAGIKTQTRYLRSSAGNYQLVSNPYRAATSAGATGESTMGWTVTTMDSVGRTARVETFDGAATPAVWPGGSNAISTGHVLTAFDTATSPLGRNTTTTDQAGKVRDGISDGLGRLLTVLEHPAGSTYTTNYQYDGLSNLTGVCQGGAFVNAVCSGGQGRTFHYDSLSRLSSAQNRESGTVTYAYDNSSNLITKTDARNITATLGYDDVNRVTSKTYSDGTAGVSYCYDGDNTAQTSVRDCTGAPSAGSNLIGELTQVRTSVSATSFGSYDPLGRVTLSQQTTAGHAYQPFSYVYKPSVGLSSESYPSGRTLAFSYDGAGRGSGVSGTLNVQTTNYASGASYTPHGALTQLSMSATQFLENRGYNSRLQPANMIMAGAGPLLSLTYSYCADGGPVCSNNNGNMWWQTIGNSTAPALSLKQAYLYDDVNRLMQATESGGASEWSESYGYDAVGNRWLSAHSGITPDPFTPTVGAWFDSNNRLTIAGAVHDQAGNQQQIGGYTNIYDAENRMTSSAVNGVTTSYGYDGDGRRVTKTTGANTVTYVYDAAGELAAEYGGTAAAPCATCYLASDHLGSTRMILDGATGHAVAFHDYLPFGQEIPAGVGGRDSRYPSADTLAQKFTGQERDSETGLDFFGARYFSGAQARFASPDPENATAFLYPDDPQSWNGYSYGRNNPLTYVDPDGMNYRVCDTQGHCQDWTDQQWETWRKQQGNKVIYTAGGNILDSETEKKIGSAQYYNEKLAEALKEAGDRADVLIKDAAKTMVIDAAMAGTGVIALRGLGYLGETAQRLGVFQNTKVLVNFAHNLMNARGVHIPPPGGVAEVQQAVEGAIQTGNYALKGNGLFEGTTQINGVAVGFRGRFVDGIARVATVFTKR